MAVVGPPSAEETGVCFLATGPRKPKCKSKKPSMLRTSSVFSDPLVSNIEKVCVGTVFRGLLASALEEPLQQPVKAGTAADGS